MNVLFQRKPFYGSVTLKQFIFHESSQCWLLLMAKARGSWLFHSNQSSVKAITGFLREETKDWNYSETAFWNKMFFKPSFLLLSEHCTFALWPERHLDCLKQEHMRDKQVLLLNCLNTQS